MSKTPSTKTTKRSQRQRVLDLLNQGKKLTQAQARTTYNILSLSSRVNELRQSGELIDSVPYRNKTGRMVVQYQRVKDRVSKVSRRAL